MHQELGKIKKASFGFGGYQDCQIVFEFVLGGKGWGCTYTIGACWGNVTEKELKTSTNHKWTHEDRIKALGETAWSIIPFLQNAKVLKLHELEGKPIRATFDSPCGQITSMEILEEVL